MLALDAAGNLSGSCTTSGLAFKRHGRVGDSPVIGAALYVDNEVGAACATGVGEEVLKTLGAFLIVELMRQGASPQEACEEGVRRIARRNPQVTADSSFQVGVPGPGPRRANRRLRRDAVVPVRRARRARKPAGAGGIAC